MTPHDEYVIGPNGHPNAAHTLPVSHDCVGCQLDVFVARSIQGATRSEAQRLIDLPECDRAGVRVNSRRERSSYRLRPDDVVTVQRPDVKSTSVLPETIPLTVVYEDSHLLVIDKPRGMVVHPAPGSPSGTLVNAVLAHADDLSGIGGEQRPGIVHRLDKDTGGLLVVAKNDSAHRALQAQIEARTAARRYQAIVWGIPAFRDAVVDAPIGRHPADRKKMAVITDPRHASRRAVTHLTVRETFHDTIALIDARLETGRTHQIRVHCAHIKHPIVGDPVYGGVRRVPVRPIGMAGASRIQSAIEALNGQALHAVALEFTHPASGTRMSFQVDPAPEILNLLTVLRGE